MSKENTEEKSFTIVSEEVITPNAETMAGWQIILKLTNKHGVGIGGKVYARVGLTEVISQLMGVLPDQTTVIDFRHSSGPITKIYTNELLCAHTNQHVFSFEINNPANGTIYAGTVN